MLNILSMTQGMEADAEAYDELNQPQIDAGSKFIRELNLHEGNTVIDVGCGTGDLTKHIADIVGSDGEVVGIDPDEARIKIAKKKFSEVGNLQFLVGSSATGFPHDAEPYYDVHISTAVFHWLRNDEKKLYLQKAYHCLKPDGKLAISCPLLPEKIRDHADQQLEEFKTYPLTKDGYLELFEDVGLFPNVVVKETAFRTRLASLEVFKRWMKASTHRDVDEMPDGSLHKEYFKEFVTVDADGSVAVELPYAKITASKI